MCPTAHTGASQRRKPLSVAEVAEYLGVTERWVRRAIEERRFPYTKVGHLVRIQPDDLDTYVQTNRVPSAQL